MSYESILKRTVKGGGLLFAGMILSDVIKFIYRIIVSRYLGPSSYGLLSLGEGVLNMALLFSVLGLQVGAVKFIAQYLGEENIERIKEIIVATFRIIFPVSIIILLLIIIFSQYIAIGIFHQRELIPIIVIFALTLPFASFNNTLASIFVALKKINYWNYLTALVRPISLLIITIVIIFFKGDAADIAIATLGTYILSAGLGAYLLEFKTLRIFRSRIAPISDYKRLLTFSFPLFFSGFFVVAMGWIDTFFLGALKTSSEVGIYNAVMPLVNTLTILVSAFGSIFLPISSELLAKKEESQMAGIYSTISRWMFLLSFPILLIVLAFSQEILIILYGQAYASGAIALQILIVATFIRAITGPAPKLLITFNKTKTLFYTNVMAATINLILNYILIPKYSIVGAAAATFVSLVLRDLALFVLARKNIALRYSYKTYLKYFVSAIIPFLIILLISRFIEIHLLTLIGIIILYALLYLISLFRLKSFTSDDLIIIEAVEKKIGINLGFLKKRMIK